MWGYYGSKFRLAKKYPAPAYDKIVEPFAGAAQYSLLHFEKDVHLYDKYEVVARLWKWLQLCSPQDIMSLPRLKEGESVESFTWDCEEAKWLMGFLIGAASASPRTTATAWRSTMRPQSQTKWLRKVADQLYKIKHWSITHGDYTSAGDHRCTWFVDPPYQKGGHVYRHGNKSIDFDELGKWCLERSGQLIVCENASADWLSFEPMSKLTGNRKTTIECMYYRTDATADEEQLKIEFA